MAWEGEKIPIHGSNKGLMISNAVNNNGVDGDATGDGGTQESGGLAVRGGSTEMRRCYYYKKEGHLNPDCLKIKEKRAAEEAKNAASGGEGKVEISKGTTKNHRHTMLVDKFEDFSTGAEYHLFFSKVVKKSRNLPVR